MARAALPNKVYDGLVCPKCQRNMPPLTLAFDALPTERLDDGSLVAPFSARQVGADEYLAAFRESHPGCLPAA